MFCRTVFALKSPSFFPSKCSRSCTVWQPPWCISDQQGCPSCYYYCSTTPRTFGFDSERGTCTSLCPVSVEFPRLSRITPSFLGASISGSANSLIDSLAYQNRVDSQLCREPASGWLHSAAINGCVHASFGMQLNAQNWHLLAQWDGIASETKTHVVLVLNLPLWTGD